LLDGVWTAPENVIPEVTVALDTADSSEAVSFGWDYQATAAGAATCDNSFEFVEDRNLPDDTQLPPNTPFTKTWLIRNNGTCPWSPEYSIAFVDGDQMSASERIPLTRTVSPGSALEVAIDMVAPEEPGTYRGNWQIADASGVLFGEDGVIEDAFWLQVVVAEDAPPLATPGPNSVVLGGVVWDDFCVNSSPVAGVSSSLKTAVCM
jgi:hypothetical protein